MTGMSTVYGMPTKLTSANNMRMLRIVRDWST
jgi:hypothetical protein